MNTSFLAKTSILTLVVGGIAGAAAMSADAKATVSVADVPSANARAGVADNVLTTSATETAVAWGNLPLTNPDTANGVTHYGYNTAVAGPLTQARDEAHKTEPDTFTSSSTATTTSTRATRPAPAATSPASTSTRPTRPSGSAWCPTSTAPATPTRRSTASPGTRSPTSCS